MLRWIHAYLVGWPTEQWWVNTFREISWYQTESTDSRTISLTNRTHTFILFNSTSVPGLPRKDCAGSCNSWVRRSEVSAIDVTAKTFFKRLYLVLGLAPIGASSQLSLCSLPSSIYPTTISRFFCNFFPGMTPQFHLYKPLKKKIQCRWIHAYLYRAMSKYISTHFMIQCTQWQLISMLTRFLSRTQHISLSSSTEPLTRSVREGVKKQQGHLYRESEECKCWGNTRAGRCAFCPCQDGFDAPKAALPATHPYHHNRLVDNGLHTDPSQVCVQGWRDLESPWSSTCHFIAESHSALQATTLGQYDLSAWVLLVWNSWQDISLSVRPANLKTPPMMMQSAQSVCQTQPLQWGQHYPALVCFINQ